MFADYVTPNGGRALIDRELYLPEKWTDDRDRCRAAGIGDDAGFATKPRLAEKMIGRAGRGDLVLLGRQRSHPGGGRRGADGRAWPPSSRGTARASRPSEPPPASGSRESVPTEKGIPLAVVRLATAP
jgi:hypothetical protein